MNLQAGVYFSVFGPIFNVSMNGSKNLMNLGSCLLMNKIKIETLE